MQRQNNRRPAVSNKVEDEDWGLLTPSCCDMYTHNHHQTNKQETNKNPSKKNPANKNQNRSTCCLRHGQAVFVPVLCVGGYVIQGLRTFTVHCNHQEHPNLQLELLHSRTVSAKLRLSPIGDSVSESSKKSLLHAKAIWFWQVVKLQLKACGNDLAAMQGSSMNETEITNNTQKESGNSQAAGHCPLHEGTHKAWPLKGSRRKAAANRYFRARLRDREKTRQRTWSS